MGRARARPAERAHHAGGFPIEDVGGQVQLRGRAGVGARVGGDDPVQQGAEGAVREHACGEVERDHAEGLHAGRVEGVRQGFPLLVQ